MQRGGRNTNPFDDDDDSGFGAASRSGGGGRGYGTSGGDGYGTRGGSGYGTRGGDGYGTRGGENGYGTRGGDGYGSRGGDGYGDYDSGPSMRGGHEERMVMANRRMEESSASSLRALNETMRMGIETTEELERQAESVDRTERRLDEMHVELDKGERNMRRIKSPFGGIGNYFARKKTVEEVIDPKGLKPQAKRGASSTTKTKPTTKKQQQQLEAARGTGNAVVDQNLDEMEKALYQLRGIGEVMNTQLDDSEQQLDRVKYKMDRDHVKMEKLNKDIKRELYK